jgi:hypothetical protein
VFRTAFFRFFLLTAFIAACTRAASADTPNVWTSLTSENFSISGNASVVDLRRTAERLEQFRWAFSQAYPDLKLDNGRPTQIVVFRDAASYFSFLPRRADGSTDVGVAGYFQTGEDRNYITFALSTTQADPFSTVVHEYVHSLIDANFDHSERYFRETTPGHALVDLKTANRDQLLASGVLVQNIYISPLCTITDIDLFFSYRIEKKMLGRTGRLMSVIGRL